MRNNITKMNYVDLVIKLINQIQIILKLSTPNFPFLVKLLSLQNINSKILISKFVWLLTSCQKKFITNEKQEHPGNSL